jgi:polyisoprenoid-binding protein YceI
MKFSQIIMLSALIAVSPYTGNWIPDSANAKINFTVNGPFGTVHGSFSGLKATIVFDEKDLSANSIIASIDAKTINTGIGLRNSHLRNKEEWLNTDKYPEISFHSKKIEKTDKGYKAMGDLKLKGIIKPVEIPFTFIAKDAGGIFKGQFDIKREDYKVGDPGGSVGDIITILLELPVKK